MCGIIGYVGPQGTDVTTILLDGLSKLEYRGYDSAGIAVLTSTGTLEVRRRAGKIANLVASVEMVRDPDGGHWALVTHAGQRMAAPMTSMLILIPIAPAC